MPPLTARELDRWERRFARSLEDLELLHASDGQLARRETKDQSATGARAETEENAAVLNAQAFDREEERCPCRLRK